MRKIIFLIICFAVTCQFACGQGLIIHITSPETNSQVPCRPFAEGTVSDPKAKVWVIVHPVGTSDYWVQPPVSVREDSTWRVLIYIGDCENQQHVGLQFEIVAVANPKEKLYERLVLTEWPEAVAISQIIEVIRK